MLRIFWSQISIPYLDLTYKKGEVTFFAGEGNSRILFFPYSKRYFFGFSFDVKDYPSVSFYTFNPKKKDFHLDKGLYVKKETSVTDEVRLVNNEVSHMAKNYYLAIYENKAFVLFFNKKPFYYFKDLHEMELEKITKDTLEKADLAKRIKDCF